MNDGDTIFALATGRRDEPGIDDGSVTTAVLNDVLDQAAAVFAEACTSAILSAIPRGGPPAYAVFLASPRRPRR
jgi:L-aminopeptidase/D-esterase-like protein